MAQYIDRDALVAKIEKKKKINKECMLALKNLYYQGKVDAFNDTLYFIGTLEMKEVDLEKEVEKYLLTNATFLIGGDSKLVVHNIAKHFFELGLKAQKGE